MPHKKRKCCKISKTFPIIAQQAHKAPQQMMIIIIFLFVRENNLLYLHVFLLARVRFCKMH